MESRTAKKGNVGKLVFYIASWVTGFFLITFFLIGFFREDIDRFLVHRKEARDNEQYLSYWKEQSAIEEAKWRVDTYGGATPEQTLDLLITALEKNDAELVSRYYVPNQVENEFAEYQKEVVEKGDFSSFIEYFKKIRSGEKWCSEDGKQCSIEVFIINNEDYYVQVSGTDTKIFVPKGQRERSAVEFQFNKFTNIWKLKS